MSAFIESAEIEEIEQHRLLHLVSERTGQEDDRDVRLAHLDRPDGMRISRRTRHRLDQGKKIPIDPHSPLAFSLVPQCLTASIEWRAWCIFLCFTTGACPSGSVARN